jgi:hypothetical protein
MTPRMSKNELSLFTAFVGCSDTYVEFGCGGSTFVASSLVKSRIVSVDSSEQWIGKVAESCTASPVQPKLVFVDIGPTGEWGMPLDQSSRSQWPRYHSDIWASAESMEADLFMVDGRFRVACFAQIVLHCRPSALIAIHDFASRPSYHKIYDIGFEIATTEDLSIFRPNTEKKGDALRLLDQCRHDPA